MTQRVCHLMKLLSLVLVGFLLTGCAATSQISSVEEAQPKLTETVTEAAAEPADQDAEVIEAETGSETEPEIELEPEPSATVEASAAPSATKSASPSPTGTSTPEPTASPTPTDTEPAGFTMAMVSENASSLKCWSVIRGNVFDLTDWIDSHPGGSNAILSICGKEATTTFDNRHRGQGSPEAALQRYLLGPLAG